MKPNIIGLTGPAGVGKDTVGDLLTRYGYRKYAMAGPLKSALAALGMPEPANREDKERAIPGRSYSYRHAAQTLGTEWARNCLEPHFWIKLAEQNTQGSGWVITDIRFEDEASMVRSRGGQIWHIQGRATTVTAHAAKHASEAGIAFIPGDVMINNNADIGHLLMQVQSNLWQANHAATPI